MSEVNYSCADVGDHELIQCGQWKKGGISGFALIELDHTITDPTNPTQWTTNIGTGKVHMVGGHTTFPQNKGIKAEYPDPSPVETENPSSDGPDNILDGFSHVFNFMDANVVSNNDTFYENVNSQPFYLAWFNHVNNTISWVDKICAVVVPPANSPMSNKERRRYSGKVTWSSEPNVFPTLYPAPSGIFN
jgi:hypothetical protein